MCSAADFHTEYAGEAVFTQLIEAEISQQLGADKSERAERRNGYNCGYRPRRLDARMGDHVSHGAKGTSRRLHAVLYYHS